MPNKQPETLVGIVLDHQATFSVMEFCQACSITVECVTELVDEGVIEPVEAEPEWQFQGDAVVRAIRACRLVNDLGLNWPGAALALELLDEIDRLEMRRARTS